MQGLVLLSLPAALLLPAAPPSPSQPLPPAFSWETLPIFIHVGNNSGPFNDEAIGVMAKFAMVTLDKWMGPCGQRPDATPACDEEGVMLAEARRIKRANPNVSVLLYWNSVLDFPQYTLHAGMLARPELMLRNRRTGNIVRLDGGGHTGMDVFDFANPAARTFFMSDCLNATRSGVVDGCYMDRATDVSPVVNLSAAQAREYEAGHITMLSDLQALLGEGPVVGNGAYGPPHDQAAIAYAMIEEFSPLHDKGKGNLTDLFTSVKNGRGVQVHTMTAPTENVIAAFLIGAGPHCYFGFGSWSTIYDDLSDRWSPLFDLPLGPPLSDAVLNEASATYHRQFAHGVNVSFNMKTGHGEVDGWAFPPPPPPPPLPPTPPAPPCCAAKAGCLYSGGNLASSRTPLESATACCGSCSATDACAFWSFSVASKMCRLHSVNATEHRDAPGTISVT
eukprot:COSAG01_NODE_3412_length_6112_cov_2.531354_8_plen_448_part_00